MRWMILTNQSSPEFLSFHAISDLVIIIITYVFIHYTGMLVAEAYIRTLYIAGFAVNFFLYTVNGTTFRKQFYRTICHQTWHLFAIHDSNIPYYTFVIIIQLQDRPRPSNVRPDSQIVMKYVTNHQ